jgi:regulator of protease activity HflC (stomatin/prohibitin superfamily)
MLVDKFFFIILLISFISIIINLSIHKVEEGHVGIYWRGGALLKRITKPGWHFKFPFIDQFENVQVTIQTDKVTNIPCGTSGGVLIWFDRVEVVNRLKEPFVYETIKNYTINYDKLWIFDKIHHEINQFCSKHTLQEVYIDLFHTVDDRLQAALQESCNQWAPGIEIVSIRITKPRIPENILKNYEAMEAQKTKFLVTVETQKVAQKEAETEKLKATIEAQKQAEVSKIAMEQQIMEKESIKKMKILEDEAILHHEKTVADAEFYKIKMLSEANLLLLTPEYLKSELIKSISNTTKVYFGPSMSSLFLDFLDTITNQKLTSTKQNSKN